MTAASFTVTAGTQLYTVAPIVTISGGGGVSDDFPLAGMYAHARTLRIADGPDEVHKMSIARRELHRYQPQEQPVPS